jgi:transposase
MQGKELPGQSALGVYVGIDVCKEWLDAYLHPIGQWLRVENSYHGIKKLKRILAGYRVVLVVVEATGKFHRQVQRTLHAADLAVAVINPLRSRLFAEAQGQLAKTDPIDARMLALYGQALSPAATPPLPETVEELQEIVRARQEATADLTTFKNRRTASSVAFLRREIESVIKRLELHIDRLEHEIIERIEREPALLRRYEILLSIPGIGRTVAAILLVGMSELGSCSNRAVALLAGLAPIACDSGAKDGKRHIKGGRSFVRSALYMAGVAAARCNPDLKAFYKRLRLSHPPKLVLTAVMRKLVVLANTLLKEDRLWLPIRP